MFTKIWIKWWIKIYSKLISSFKYRKSEDKTGYTQSVDNDVDKEKSFKIKAFKRYQHKRE